MRTSRRSLIKLGLYVTASFVPFLEGVSGRVALAAGQKAAAQVGDGFWLRRDLFEAAVGDRFAVRKPQGGSVSLRLVRVDDVPSAQQAGAVDSPDCYVVVFTGPRSSPLEDGTYRVDHSTLGTFYLFIVPGPSTSAGLTYTATFNRMQAR
jgi:hypothetical protein